MTRSSSPARGTTAALTAAVALVAAATLVHPSKPALAGQCPAAPAADAAPDVRDPLFAEQMAVLVRRWVAEGAAPAPAR
ncbi:hypothetical protein [Caldimonas sp. KR1-144]|uniref:hypothetical protein n=1 Tax=Caldimonas sp. KR1-144 TaxID=3400911 RepID=UPI003BFD95CC